MLIGESPMLSAEEDAKQEDLALLLAFLIMIGLFFCVAYADQPRVSRCADDDVQCQQMMDDQESEAPRWGK